jgi:hypothetical protein
MAFGQSFGNNNSAAATTLATAATAVSTGSTLVVGASCDSSAGTINSVTDGVNVFNIQGTVQVDSTNNQNLGIYVADNITGGTRAITANYSASVGFRFIHVVEMTGRAVLAVDQSPGFHATTTGTTATDAVVSAAVTTGFAGEDFVCLVMDTVGVAVYTKGTNWTLGSTSSQLSSEYMLNQAAGSITGTWTFGTAHAYICAIVTLKAAPVAVSVSPPSNAFM